MPFDQKTAALAARLVTPGVVIIAAFLASLSTMAWISLRPNLGMARIGEGVTLANYLAFISDPFNLTHLSRSFRIACYTTFLILVAAYPLAYFLTLCGRRLRLIISVLLLVQFFTSYVIRTYAVVLLLGRYGIVNNSLIRLGLIDEPIKLLFSEFAVAVGLIMIGIPFMTLSIYGGLATIPPGLVTAAVSLGATRRRAFWQVIFPLSLPGVAAGVTVVYLFGFTAFIMPNLLGGTYFDLIANLIYDKAMNAQNYPFAAASAMIALGPTLLTVYLIQKGFSWFIRGAGR